jgi:uncharacterized protein
MTRPKLNVSERDGACRFPVYLQPRASRDELAGLHEGALRIRLTSPALRNRANRHLIDFLASLLRVAKSRVSLASGERSRTKTVVVSGLSEARLLDLVTPYLVD